MLYSALLLRFCPASQAQKVLAHMHQRSAAQTAAGATSKEKGCQDAPAGAYVDKMGQVTFQLCQQGTYQNLEGECCEVLALQACLTMTASF